MTVLVDTPVWSFAYRRAKRSPREQSIVNQLVKLIHGEEAVLIGAIRQEILTGIKDSKQFENVRTTLRGFPDLSVEVADFETAADLHNRCRREGVQGSPADFLICAVAMRYDAPIFTTDRDFKHYAKYIGVQLHVSPSG